MKIKYTKEDILKDLENSIIGYENYTKEDLIKRIENIIIQIKEVLI